MFTCNCAGLEGGRISALLNNSNFLYDLALFQTLTGISTALFFVKAVDSFHRLGERPTFASLSQGHTLRVNSSELALSLR